MRGSRSEREARRALSSAGPLVESDGSTGLQAAQKAVFETPTPDVVKTTKIKGKKLDTQQVRASRLPRLGSNFGQALPESNFQLFDGRVLYIFAAKTP